MLQVDYKKLVHLAKFTHPKDLGVLGCVHIKEGTQHGVSTDGNRLHLEPTLCIAPAPFSINIPKNLITALKKEVKLNNMAPPLTANITMTEGELTIAAVPESHGVAVTGSSTPGQYPAYLKLIPKGPHSELTFSKRDMIQAIKLVKPYFNAALKKVIIKIEGEELRVEPFRISGENKEGVAVPFTGWVYPHLTHIIFNTSYLKEAMTLAKKSMRIEVSYSGNVTTFRDPDANFTHVLMPIQPKGSIQ